MQHSSLCGHEVVEFLAKGSVSPQPLPNPFISSLLGKGQNFLEKFFRETLTIQIVILKYFLKFKQEAVLASSIAFIRVIRSNYMCIRQTYDSIKVYYTVVKFFP